MSIFKRSSDEVITKLNNTVNELEETVSRELEEARTARAAGQAIVQAANDRINDASSKLDIVAKYRG